MKIARVERVPSMKKPQMEHLQRLLNGGILSKDNAERCIHICYDAAKIIHCRQERLKKRQLKVVEFTTALALAHFHHSATYRFTATGALAENFKSCPEEKALDYYQNKVMGTCPDQYGRTIFIDEDGMRYLYKEKGTGDHAVASENYEESRGKRLPWIRHVLSNSKAVYVVEEIVHSKFRRTYLYASIATIPLAGESSISYFLVVVVEEGNKRLVFRTAYAVESGNRFLKYIERGRPLAER